VAWGIYLLGPAFNKIVQLGAGAPAGADLGKTGRWAEGS